MKLGRDTQQKQKPFHSYLCKLSSFNDYLLHPLLLLFVLVVAIGLLIKHSYLTRPAQAESAKKFTLHSAKLEHLLSTSPLVMLSPQSKEHILSPDTYSIRTMQQYINDCMFRPLGMVESKKKYDRELDTKGEQDGYFGRANALKSFASHHSQLFLRHSMVVHGP